MKLDHASPSRAGAREPESGSEALTREDRAQLLRYMLMMRKAEERGLTLYKQGKVPGSFYDGRGQEAVCVGASFVLGPRDRTCILHRDLGAHFVRGVTPDRYLANYMGRSGGVTGGKDGNMHFGDRELGSVGMVSMLPDMAPVATGLALSFKMRMHGHGAHDDMSYVPDGMLERWAERDPIDLYRGRLADEHGFATDELEAIEAEVTAYIGECAERALASPMPEPEHATDGVFAGEWAPLGDGQARWSRWSAPAPEAPGPNGHHNGDRKLAATERRAA